MAGRKPIPIKAVDTTGKEYFYDSVDEFMQNHEPEPSSEIKAWGQNSKNALRKVARGDKKFNSYGGWRLSYLIEGGKGKYTTVPGTITTRDRDKFERPESEVREIEAIRQQELDYAEMMTGGAGDPEKLKPILRRQFLDVGVKIAKRRNGEWEPPKGWKPSEDLEFLERIAEVNGIDWRHIADTRTDAEMFTDGINRLVAEGVTAAMELVDEELEVIHEQMVKAVEGVRKEIVEIAKEEDAATDVVRETFKADGSAQPGVSVKALEEEDDESHAADESQRDADCGDDADEPDLPPSGGSGGAGGDGPPGGADRPPASGSEV